MSKELMRELLRDDSSGGEKSPPGMSWDKFFSDVGSEMKHLGSQGSHEIAAALFHGNAFVMYPRAGQEDQEQSQVQAIEPMHQQEQDRGGMEI